MVARDGFPAGAVRPLRFNTGPGRTPDRAALVASAQEIERLGYSTFALADHFRIPLAPLVALQAVADATSTLRLTQTVLNQDFRHPAVLAKELATLDLLSGGRVQVGIGAGWMRAEYEQAGLTYDPAPVRIARLEEVAVILRGLFGPEPFSFHGKHFTVTDLDGLPKPVQRPHPPIMIGGGGRRLLGVAGRQADIVQIMPRLSPDRSAPEPRSFSAEVQAQKIDWVRQAAGDRFADIELGAQLLHVSTTDDPDQAFDAFVTRFGPHLGVSGPDAAVMRRELLDSPLVAVGSPDEVCAKILATREHLGISYFTTPMDVTPAAFAPVVARLAGR